MELVHEKDEFLIMDDEKEVGFIRYRVIDDIMYINSTVVDPEYRRQGLAKDLVLVAAKFAREQNIKVIPRCSYVVDMFDRGGFEDIDAR